MTKKIENSLGDLKDKVVPASEIKIPETKPMTMEEWIEVGIKSQEKYIDGLTETVMAGNPTKKDKVVNASEIKVPEIKTMTLDEVVKFYKKQCEKVAFPSIKATQFEQYSENVQALVELKAKKVEIESSGIKNTGNWVFGEMPEWTKQVENYCNENNLTVQDLIAFHREHSKSKFRGKNKPAGGKETIPAESKHLNWRENLTKKKTGQ